VSALAVLMNGAASAVAPAYFSNSRRRMKTSPIGFFRACPIARREEAVCRQD
jgi:hypothetical protein